MRVRSSELTISGGNQGIGKRGPKSIGIPKSPSFAWHLKFISYISNFCTGVGEKVILKGILKDNNEQPLENNEFYVSVKETFLKCAIHLDPKIRINLSEGSQKYFVHHLRPGCATNYKRKSTI